jgi:hypothetical protein
LARRSKRTPEVEARLLDAVRGGNTLKAACAYAGIGVQTMDDWRDRFRDFRDALTRAQAAPEVRNVAIIQQAASEDWRAAAWWLERRRPEDYGRRVGLDVNLRRMAGRIADGEGLDALELIAEAERITREYG